MTNLDALLAGCALALTVFLAVLALRDGVAPPQGRALAAVAISVYGSIAPLVSLATEEMRDEQLASILRNALVGVPVTGMLLQSPAWPLDQ